MRDEDPPARRSRWRSTVAALVAYAALSAAGHRSLLPVLATDVYSQELLGNDCLLHAWTLAWDQHALATRPCDVFDANIFFPHRRTLLYSDHLLGLAAVLSPLRLVTANALLVHNLATVAAPALDAAALYALALELTGVPLAAFVGGLLYGFAPMRFRPDACQIQMLAAWWLPLVLLLARRTILRGRVRDAVATGLVLALQGLSGIYLTAYFAPFLALAHLWWLRRHPPARHRRGWIALVVAEVAAAAILVPPSLAYRAVQAELGTSRALYTNALLTMTPVGDFLPPITLGTLVVVAVLLVRAWPRRARGEAPLHLAIAIGGCVLALGPSLPLPWGGAVMGPYRLLLFVPGYDALRAPGRFAHVALLGAAVVAAAGVAVLARRASGGARAALVVGVAGALLVESLPPALGTMRVPDPPTMGRVLPWLVRHRDDARVVYLPIDAYAITSAVYQYTTTWHWTPVANGNMGLVPPMHPYLVRESARFPDDETVATFRALGLTHVVARVDRMPAVRDGRLARALARPHPLLKRVVGDRGTMVLAIRPRAKAAHVRLAGRPLDRAAWRATASHAAGEAAWAIDGDRQSSWRSWADVDAALGRWHQPVTARELDAAFTASLPVWLEVDLGAVAELTGVGVRLGGTDPLIAPSVVVELSEDRVAWRPAPGRLRAVPTIRGLVRRPRDARYAVVFDAPSRARWVRFLGGGLEMRVGDVTVRARADAPGSP
jgi:hypothetical protein